MQNIPELDELIKYMSKLPGLGPKSAKRIILKLLNNKDKILKPLVNSMANVFKNISRCKKCGALKSNISGCENCKSGKHNSICVVETIADQWSIESLGVYKGYFHILGGNVIGLNSTNKENLLIESLINRVSENNINEVILATSATVEGQTTAFFIQDKLKSINVKVTKLAQGIPIGGEIENLDDGTLISAFKYRKIFKDNSD